MEKQYLNACFGIGFYSILILFLGAVDFNAYLMKQKTTEFGATVSKTATTSIKSPTDPQKAFSDSKFCSECGHKNLNDDNFCKNCGHKLGE